MTQNADYVPGDRVEWVSTATGDHHTGEVLHGDNGVGKVLVRPDGHSLRWTAWEPIESMTRIGTPAQIDGSGAGT